MNVSGQPTIENLQDRHCTQELCNAVTCAGCPLNTSATRKALADLFQACSKLPIEQMDMLEKEINAAAEALK